MIKSFNNLDSAIRFYVPNTHFHFVVADEMEGMIFTDYEGNEYEQTRRFLVFKDAQSYYDCIDHYNHCHEIIVPRTRNNNMTSCFGRLAFDFDIPNAVTVPSTFKADIESLILHVLGKHYTGVDASIIECVWMSCANPKKISKHMVVKNLVFSDWVDQSSLFYHQMLKEMKDGHFRDHFSWAGDDPSCVIDMMLARNKATLRMPMNSKLHGNPMLLDEPSKHTFFDGLVCQYAHDEQRVFSYQCNDNIYNYKMKKRDKKYHNKIEITEIVIDDVIVDDAFELFKRNVQDDAFELMEVSGPIIHLKRKHPSRCPINGKMHENDNAFIFVHQETKNAYFYCRRKCVDPSTGKEYKLLNKKVPIPTIQSRAKIGILGMRVMHRLAAINAGQCR